MRRCRRSSRRGATFRSSDLRRRRRARSARMPSPAATNTAKCSRRTAFATRPVAYVTIETPAASASAPPAAAPSASARRDQSHGAKSATEAHDPPRKESATTKPRKSEPSVRGSCPSEYEPASASGSTPYARIIDARKRTAIAAASAGATSQAPTRFWVSAPWTSRSGTSPMPTCFVRMHAPAARPAAAKRSDSALLERLEPEDDSPRSRARRRARRS